MHQAESYGGGYGALAGQNYASAPPLPYELNPYGAPPPQQQQQPQGVAYVPLPETGYPPAQQQEAASYNPNYAPTAPYVPSYGDTNPGAPPFVDNYGRFAPQSSTPPAHQNYEGGGGGGGGGFQSCCYGSTPADGCYGSTPADGCYGRTPADGFFTSSRATLPAHQYSEITLLYPAVQTITQTRWVTKWIRPQWEERAPRMEYESQQRYRGEPPQRPVDMRYVHRHARPAIDPERRPVERRPRDMPPPQPPMMDQMVRPVERLVHTVPEPVLTEEPEEAIRKVVEVPVPTATPPLTQPIELNARVCCQKCAKDLEKCLHQLEGVEKVITDQYNAKVTVYGRVDPSRVIERVKRMKKSWAMTVDYSENYRRARAAEDAASGM